MKNFDERFWITVMSTVFILGFDALVYVVPSKLDPQFVSSLVMVLNVQGLINGLNYWYQSSKSSQGKDDTINELTKKVGP